MSTDQLRANLTSIGFERSSTGGGTYAPMGQTPRGGYILVTDDDGADLPVYGRPVVVGLYDDDGDLIPGGMVTLDFNVDRYEIDADVAAGLPESVGAVVDAIFVQYGPRYRVSWPQGYGPGLPPEEHSLAWFSEAQGWDDADRRAVAALKPGESYHYVGIGNQVIVELLP